MDGRDIFADMSDEKLRELYKPCLREPFCDVAHTGELKGILETYMRMNLAGMFPMSRMEHDMRQEIVRRWCKQQ